MQNSKNLSQKPEKIKENQQNPVFFYNFIVSCDYILQMKVNLQPNLSE